MRAETWQAGSDEFKSRLTRELAFNRNREVQEAICRYFSSLMEIVIANSMLLQFGLKIGTVRRHIRRLLGDHTRFGEGSPLSIASSAYSVYDRSEAVIRELGLAAPSC
jgi:hypothetical protein